MLILSRKVGQRILLRVGGEIIVVKLVKGGRSHARFGIEASERVRVFREEILNEKGKPTSLEDETDF